MEKLEKGDRKMLQGVLFDMDGILFDTERMSLNIQNQLLCESGNPGNWNLVMQTCGLNAVQREKLLADTFGPTFDIGYHEEQFRQRMLAQIDREGIPKKEGLDALLQYLQKHGYKMAVASSSRRESVLHHLTAGNILHYFSAVVGGDMVKASKPQPDIYLEAARRLGLNPTMCAAIEDSPNGVRSAAAAGCVTIMVPDLTPPNEELTALAAAVLPSLAQVPDFLQHYSPN